MVVVSISVIMNRSDYDQYSHSHDQSQLWITTERLIQDYPILSLLIAGHQQWHTYQPLYSTLLARIHRVECPHMDLSVFAGIQTIQREILPEIVPRLVELHGRYPLLTSTFFALDLPWALLHCEIRPYWERHHRTSELYLPKWIQHETSVLTNPQRSHLQDMIHMLYYITKVSPLLLILPILDALTTRISMGGGGSGGGADNNGSPNIWLTQTWFYDTHVRSSSNTDDTNNNSGLDSWLTYFTNHDHSDPRLLFVTQPCLILVLLAHLHAFLECLHREWKRGHGRSRFNLEDWFPHDYRDDAVYCLLYRTLEHAFIGLD